MKDLTLEVTLKPFYKLDAAATRKVCDDILVQWQAMIAHTDQVSIMFWASDGSEILEYQGDLDATMEWARYIGNGNAHLHPNIKSDPEGICLHARSYLYREDAELITYRRFAEIVRIWKEAITAIGKKPGIGLTFDPGGEFAPSDFKYKRHREICLADTMGKASFVCCYGILNKDDHRYAGFPEGIPQDTSLGTFLGRQFQSLAKDLGFDFIWLSNGFGFGMETWMTCGPLFDGETFTPEKAPETRDKILAFWGDFRKECPKLGIRTRGTNLGTGTDLASDATPLRELYKGGFDFNPPVNSPWAALNGDFGIEIAGYLSRIVELPPGKDIPYRFYLHDPWWLNSPWLDRYERMPHDIYLPLAASRINIDGKTEVPQTLNLLTIDDSYGLMPEAVPNESTPHLLRAWNERPDTAGPIVWLYPFDELHDAMFQSPQQPDRLFHNDWFVREALNDGFPVSTVISTRSFAALGDKVREVLGGRILLTPAPFNAKMEKLLLDWAEAGGQLLVYGPLGSAPRLREKLGLKEASPLAGRMDVRSALTGLDSIQTDKASGAWSGDRFNLNDKGSLDIACTIDSFDHRNIMSGGPLSETPAPGASIPVVASQGGESRALAAHYDTPAGGKVWWLRGPLPLTMEKGTHLPKPDDRAKTFPFGELVRQALADFGWIIRFRAMARDQRHPVLALHRHENGWFFSGYMPDTNVELSLKSPFGAPLFLGMETWIKDSTSSYHQLRGWRNECRVFLEQKDGWIHHKEELPGQIGIKRRMWVRGLKDATLRFFPPTEAGTVTYWVNPIWPYVSGEKGNLREIQTPQGRMLENITPISGDVLISW